MTDPGLNKEELMSQFIDEAKHFLAALDANSSVQELSDIREKVKEIIASIYVAEDENGIDKE